MTKSLRKTLIFILSALFLLCAGFAMFGGTTAKALDNVEGHQTHGQSIKNTFQFNKNVDVAIFDDDPSGELDCQIRYAFNILDSAHTNLFEYGEPTRTEWWGGENKSFFAYTFTLYRLNKDGVSAQPLKSIMIVFEYLRIENDPFASYDDSYFLIKTIAEKEHTYSSEDILLSPFDYEDLNSSLYTTPSDTVKNYIKSNGFKVKNSKKLIYGVYDGSTDGLSFYFNEDTGEAVIYFTLRVDSPYTDYFVEFDYYYSVLGFSGILSTEYDVTKGTIDSAVCSIYSVVKDLDEKGTLPEYFFAKQAREILDNNNIQRVKIKYLEQIGDTPFAKAVYTYVNVPAVQNVIRISDVYTALGIESFDCLGSNCLNFIYDSTTDTYVAKYLKNVWLRSITEDGKYSDYFLDINLSYQDYYYQFVEDDIFSNELYEWIFSTQMLTKYPKLKGLKFSEVYGYFGMVVVPNTHTINTAIAEMFDMNVSESGIIKSFYFESILSQESYQKLLTDYEYPWLSKAWEGVWSTITGDSSATYYLLFSEPGTDRGHIGEGGQESGEDTDSVVGGVVGEVGGVVGGVIEDVWEGGKNLISGFSGILGGVFSFIGSAGGIITFIVLAVVAIVVIKLLKNKN